MRTRPAGTPAIAKPGWWDAMVGPGRPFDTDRYFVICSNVLGGCQGSTGPSSTNPATGQPYGARFPVLTIGDMVRAQARLLDRLGIERLLAVAAARWAASRRWSGPPAYPERVRGAILLATSARSSPQTLAWNAIGRRAIMSDPRWRGGDYYDGEPPADGLAVARMIGHITYLSEPSLERKFGRAFQDGERAGLHAGARVRDRELPGVPGRAASTRASTPTRYLYITKAMDYWDLPARYGSLDAALARSQAGVPAALLHQRLALPDPRVGRDRRCAAPARPAGRARRARVERRPRRLSGRLRAAGADHREISCALPIYLVQF